MTSGNGGLETQEKRDGQQTTFFALTVACITVLVCSKTQQPHTVEKEMVYTQRDFASLHGPSRITDETLLTLTASWKGDLWAGELEIERGREGRRKGEKEREGGTLKLKK